MEGFSSPALAAFFAANFVAALSGGLFRPGPWYEALRKPVWRPPSWAFGPAWLVLYTMLAVSGWLAWSASDDWDSTIVYAVSLAFNAGWSAIFFGLRRMDLAFVWIVGLWLSIAAMIAVFAPVSSLAAWLLAPYLAWVAFAAALNWTIWRMNRAPV
jgi:tryptophan-rich sensory protein